MHSKRTAHVPYWAPRLTQHPGEKTRAMDVMLRRIARAELAPHLLEPASAVWLDRIKHPPPRILTGGLSLSLHTIISAKPESKSDPPVIHGKNPTESELRPEGTIGYAR